MGMMKEMGMQIEEQVYGCIEDIIPECEDIAEALERGVEIAREQDLDRFISIDYVVEAIHEMWNEFWSDYN